MKTRTILLCTAVALSVGTYAAQAQSFGSGPRYVPRPVVAESDYTATNRMEDRSDAESYEQYEQREPCQNYRELPRHYRSNCEKNEVYADSAVNMRNTRLLPITRTYTVLFDFDRSDIRRNESETLNQVMLEARKYGPRQITVTGYTDSAGSEDYNQTLSREREQAVSRALLERGLENRTLAHDARGEHDQAVKTADDTKNQQNRRVVVDFRN